MSASFHNVDTVRVSLVEERVKADGSGGCYHRGARGLAALLIGACLLVAGCETSHHSQPPPHYPAPPPQAQPPPPAGRPPVTVLPVVPPPRQAIAPGAWKAEADRWMGAKYRPGGMDRKGIDGPGLATRLYQSVAGVRLPRSLGELARCGQPMSRNDLQPGDLVFFITLQHRELDQVGVYLGDTKFVHVSPSKGVVVSSLLQDYYIQRYHSARRVMPGAPAPRPQR